MSKSLDQVIADKIEIQKAYQRNMHKLQMQAMSYGGLNFAPLEITNRFEEEQTKLLTLNKELEVLTSLTQYILSDEVLSVLSNQGRYNTVIASVMKLQVDMREMQIKTERSILMNRKYTLWIGVGLLGILFLMLLVRIAEVFIK